MSFSRVNDLAMDILPVQGSSVPCERLFSAAKLVVTDLRNRLSPRVMEACMVLNQKMKRDGMLDFTEHLVQGAMEEELQSLCEAFDEIPETAIDYAGTFEPLPDLPSHADGQ